MYQEIIIKASVLICAIIAFLMALSLFGYGITLAGWIVYVALIASVIVLLEFIVSIVMRGNRK